MNYKLGLGQPAPALNVSYVNLTNDDNANGFLEVSESADINVTGINMGQITSAAATITCTAIGSTAGYVTVNNPSVNVGAINDSQSIPAAFNITAHANAPLGTTIKLKFTIDDGVSSMFVTKNINIGYIVLMANNTQVTACSAVFYDAGGIDNNYTDYTDFVKTFMPLSSGQKVKMAFSNFSLEDEPSCGYDYLKIYDGPNTSSTLLGTYCGTNSPGTKTSTHATGALTVKFHSDEGTTATGWKALVSCAGSATGLNNASEVNSFEIYPNPSAGIFNIRINAAENVEITIVDMFGREVEKINSLNKESITLNYAGKANGMYFIKFRNGDKVYSEKIILNK